LNHKAFSATEKSSYHFRTTLLLSHHAARRNSSLARVPVAPIPSTPYKHSCTSTKHLGESVSASSAWVRARRSAAPPHRRCQIFGKDVGKR